MCAEKEATKSKINELIEAMNRLSDALERANRSGD